MPKTAIKKAEKYAPDAYTKDILNTIGISTVARRRTCSILLRQKQYSYRYIGYTLGVSDVCVWRYVNHDRATEYNRITQLGTVINGKSVVITGLRKRPHTHYCELCGTHIKKRFSYHHWLDDLPEVGLWLCFKCHQLAETIDERKELIDKYISLKCQTTIDCLTKKEDISG